MKKSQLEIKVLALNLLKEYAGRVYNYEKTHFAQHLGKDIFKVDGSVKQKFAHEKLPFEKYKTEDGTHVDIHYWLEYSYRSFDIKVKICVNGGSYDVQPATAFCQYETMSDTIFETKENILIETTRGATNYSHRFDATKISESALKVKEAAKVYESVLETVPYEFRNILYLERLSR